MVQIVTPISNAPFQVEGSRQGSIRFCTKIGSNFVGKTLKLQVKDPTSANDWYDTGVSFDKVGAQIVSVPFTGTFRFDTPDFADVSVSFLIL